MKNVARLLAVALVTVPASAWAMTLPQVGDFVGKDKGAAEMALKEAGCDMKTYDGAGNPILVTCQDSATNIKWQLRIDPVSGNVTNVQQAS